MTNPEKTGNATFKGMRIGVAEQGGFLIKTLVKNDGASVEQTIVIDTKQADFIRDFITTHMAEADSEPTLPEEPNEEGLYVSQQGHVLLKDLDGDWSLGSWIFKNTGETWSDDFIYTRDWDLVVKDLGMDAFPLKRIDRSDIASLAQSGNEQ